MSTATAPLILVVEDHKDSRIIFAEFLSLMGFHVATAEDGAQALIQATELLPDLILMDLSLPVLDGLEATRRLRKAERTRDIPVVALTGYTESESLQAALAAGCVAVLIKPVSPAELEAKIRQLLA